MLQVIVGQAPCRSLVCLTFMVMKTPSTYNAILVRLCLKAVCIIIFTYHLLIKFLTAHGVSEIHGNQALAKHYYMVSLQARPPGTILVESLVTCDELVKERGHPIEDLIAIPLQDGNP